MKGLKCIVLLLALFSLFSCSKDGGSSSKNDGSTVKGEILDEASLQFIGSYVSTGGDTFVFYPDGSCCLKDGSRNTWGEWTYNPETNILATTLKSWQFYVTLISDNAWTGIDIGTSDTYTFTKHSDTDFAKNYIQDSGFERVWQEVSQPDSTLCIGTSYGCINSGAQWSIDYTYGYSLDATIDTNEANYLNYSYSSTDEDLGEISFDYTLYNSDSVRAHAKGTGTFTLSNLYSINCRLKFEGAIEKEMICFY